MISNGAALGGIPQHTLWNYLKAACPGIFNAGTLTDPRSHLWAEEVWLCQKEAEYGIAPSYDEDGERVWPPVLLAWCLDLLNAGIEFDSMLPPEVVDMKMQLRDGFMEPTRPRPLPAFPLSRR